MEDYCIKKNAQEKNIVSCKNCITMVVDLGLRGMHDGIMDEIERMRSETDGVFGDVSRCKSIEGYILIGLYLSFTY